MHLCMYFNSTFGVNGLDHSSSHPHFLTCVLSRNKLNSWSLETIPLTDEQSAGLLSSPDVLLRQPPVRPPHVRPRLLRQAGGEAQHSVNPKVLDKIERLHNIYVMQAATALPRWKHQFP